MSTWKYSFVCLVVFGDLVLGFFGGGDSGEGGGVVGRMMIGDGVISAVSGLRWCLMVEGVVVCSVWTAGGGVSFSIVGCRLAGVVLVVGGLLAAVGWRGHSPAEGAGCLLLSALLLSYLEVGWFLGKVSSTRTKSFPSDNLHNGAPTKLNSFRAFNKTDGMMVIR